MTEEPRVVVVGGGLAGLSAALACAEGGARVTLLEARRRLGGATFSFRRDGLWVDNGQHVFLRCFTAYRRFLARVGAESRTVLQDRLTLPVLSPGGRVAYLRRSSLPAPLHLAGALARYAHLRPAERLRATAAAWSLARLRPERALDRRTFEEWLVEHGQSPAAIAALWNLIALPALNLPAREASLALAARVFQMGLLRDRRAGDVGYAGAPLSEVHGGPAARALAAAGSEVRLGTPARRIEAAPDGTLEVVAEGGRCRADALIVAVAHEDAIRLLPPGALPAPERLAALGTSPIVNLHVVFDRPVLDPPLAAGVWSPVQWVFDRTAPSGLAEGQYLAISLSGAAEEIALPTEVLRDSYLPALEALLPRARGAEVRAFFVTRERAATFRQAPGTERLRPGTATGIARLFLAGAWTDTGLPATMEGAVRSGIAAARQALLAVGRTRRLPGEAAA